LIKIAMIMGYFTIILIAAHYYINIVPTLDCSPTFVFNNTHCELYCANISPDEWLQKIEWGQCPQIKSLDRLETVFNDSSELKP
jgi:hypothetical protein